MQASAVAPGWRAANYRLALLMYWDLDRLPGAGAEMELCLVLASDGEHADKAREKLRQWNAEIQQRVNDGAQVMEGLPFMITPDRKD